MLKRVFAPDPLQIRIAGLEREMLQWIGDVWRDVPEREIFRIPDYFDTITHPDDPLYPYAGRELAPAARSLARRRARRHGRRYALQSYGLWQPRYGDRNYDQRAMLHTLLSCAITIPPPDIFQRLRERIELFLVHPKDNVEIPKGVKVTFPSWRVFWPPELDDCLDILKTLPDSTDALDLLEDIILGRLDTPISERPEAGQGETQADLVFAVHLELHELHLWRLPGNRLQLDDVAPVRPRTPGLDCIHDGCLAPSWHPPLRAPGIA